MARTLIQIYEIQSPSQAELCARAGVDRIGSVALSPDDPGIAAVAETARAAKSMGLSTSLIPLFSGPDDVFKLLERVDPDVVHFCESLTGPAAVPLSSAVGLQEEVGRRFPHILRM
ncbi:MAG: hypothetical protein JRI97_11645, partial [Deltaproteobacteria bacterium]|nr:hypothetical protein [Deltaproteobacteria bacterium]